MDFPGHFDQLFQQLNYQRLHGQLCDCVIVVGSRHFKAHRAVLAACSTHFRALFTVTEGDGSMSMVQLDSEVVTAEAFAALVDMMYTSTLMLGESNVMDVLLAASHLHLNAVVKACKHYLTTRTLPMSPPQGERGPGGAGHGQHGQQAAAANSRLQRSFLLQQLGLSLVSSALSGAEEDGGGRGGGGGGGGGGAAAVEQRASFPIRRFHKRKPSLSLTGLGEGPRQRPRPAALSDGTMGEAGAGGGAPGPKLGEDSKLDAVAGDDGGGFAGQEDAQMPSQSDGGRGGGGEEEEGGGLPLLLAPGKEEYRHGDGLMLMKEAGEEEDEEQPGHMQVVVKSEPLSSPEPADETSDVTSQAEGSDQVEPGGGDKVELSPEGSERSFSDPQPSTPHLLTDRKAGGDLQCGDAQPAFRISSFLSAKAFGGGGGGGLSSLSLASGDDNIPNTTMGECRLDRDAARFLLGPEALASSSLLLPGGGLPSQHLLSGEAHGGFGDDPLFLRPLHGEAGGGLGPGRSGAEQLACLDFQRSSLGLHSFPRSPQGSGGGAGGPGGLPGFPGYRRIAPKMAFGGGGGSMRMDGTQLQDASSSSSSGLGGGPLLLNGTGYGGAAARGQHGGPPAGGGACPPQLTRASADVLSKCKKALSEHNVLVVEGARKYACKICCKTFLTLTDCKKHIRVHTGEKPYACLKCGKRFSQSSHLYKHSKTTCLRWQNSNLPSALL